MELTPIYEICGNRTEINKDFWPEKPEVIPDKIFNQFITLGQDQYLYVSEYGISKTKKILISRLARMKHDLKHEDIFRDMKKEAQKMVEGYI